MRGQFMTAGAMRLLDVVLFIYILSCHPIRNKMYVPLFFAFAGIVFAIIDAAWGQEWANIATGACGFAYIVSLCIQNAVMDSRKRKEEISGGKKERRTRK